MSSWELELRSARSIVENCPFPDVWINVIFESDLKTLVSTAGSLYVFVGAGVGYALGVGAEVGYAGAAVAGKALSSASKHFFLCSFSCFGTLTSLFSHFSVAISLHSCGL